MEIVEDSEALHRIVAELTDHHERPRARPWSTEDAPADFLAGQIKGIVGFVLAVERLTGKRKLSQNRSEADRLGAELGVAEPALAAAMRATREGV